jgi:hypothetical protein
MSNVTKAVIGGLAVVVAVVLFIVLQDEGNDESPESTTTTEASTPAEPEQGGSAEKPEGQPKPDKPEEPEIATIEIEGGQPVGGVAELEFDKGDTIEFFVESDVADHVHLHGYDVMQDVAPGQRIKFSVPATLDGVFEAELEDSVVPIAEITVNP